MSGLASSLYALRFLSPLSCNSYLLKDERQRERGCSSIWPGWFYFVQSCKVTRIIFFTREESRLDFEKSRCVGDGKKIAREIRRYYLALVGSCPSCTARSTGLKRLKARECGIASERSLNEEWLTLWLQARLSGVHKGLGSRRRKWKRRWKRECNFAISVWRLTCKGIGLRQIKENQDTRAYEFQLPPPNPLSLPPRPTPGERLQRLREQLCNSPQTKSRASLALELRQTSPNNEHTFLHYLLFLPPTSSRSSQTLHFLLLSRKNCPGHGNFYNLSLSLSLLFSLSFIFFPLENSRIRVRISILIIQMNFWFRYFHDKDWDTSENDEFHRILRWKESQISTTATTTTNF